MSAEPTTPPHADWRQQLPVLSGRAVTLREPTLGDADAIVDLLSTADASRFGLEEPPSELTVLAFLQRVQRERAAGLSFTYVMIAGRSSRVAGLFQVRQLDPQFESAEADATIAPSSRGSGSFLDAARLIASFVFGAVGAHRIECRVPLHNGRANGAMRKLGAVEEGVLRRSLRRGADYVDQMLWSLLKDDWSDRGRPASARVH
jgi:RimJ/RimL family protein N-acetyltransferase